MTVRYLQYNPAPQCSPRTRPAPADVAVGLMRCASELVNVHTNMASHGPDDQLFIQIGEADWMAEIKRIVDEVVRDYDTRVEGTYEHER